MSLLITNLHRTLISKMIFEKNKIENIRAINVLAKNYNTLHYPVKLVELLKGVFPSRNFDHFSKYQLHKLLNDTLFQNYNGEEILKYKLFEHHINKQNIIAAFEINVNKSRVDFLTINGQTTSYEIKSELDNLSKLSKQMADYMLVFEYNYLVVDHRHIEKAMDLLPASFGLWSYENGEYKKYKKALLNDEIDSEAQLFLLTKKELTDSFPNGNGDVGGVLDSYDSISINKLFKKTLKSRYKSRWEFLLINRQNIFPIDIQFFFNTNISPKHIYCY
jgi:hypothetical protein